MTDIRISMRVEVGDLEYEIASQAQPTFDAMSVARVHAEKISKAMYRILASIEPDNGDDD